MQSARREEAGSSADSDDTAVARVLAGDVDAYRTLVDRYQGLVFRLGLRFLHREEDVQDYVQDVFLKAFERLGQFRRSGRFYSWLMRIAYNHGIDRTKRRQIEPLPDDCEVCDPRADPESSMLRERARQELRAAIARLPQREAVCIDLFFRFNLTYREVSRATGIPLNTVKSHVFRARQSLRRALAGSTAGSFHEL